MSSRFQAIDSLRGIAVIAMIMIHTNAYHMYSDFVKYIWNFDQFAVPAFVFCSAYILFKRPKELPLAEWLGYAKKRFLRLIIPYYIFLAIYLSFLFLNKAHELTWPFVWHSVIIWEGVDLNWLVLLFTYFIPLLSLLQYVLKKWPIGFHLYTLIAFISTTLLLGMHFPYNYRLIMWLPWSLVAITTYYVVKYEETEDKGKVFGIAKKFFLPFLTIISVVLFAISTWYLMSKNASLWHYDNKYPPNLYHLSYGFMCSIILYQIFNTKLFQHPVITVPLNFFSTYSYSIYFIHFLSIFIITTIPHRPEFNAVTFFLFITTVTVLVQSGWNWGVKFASSKKQIR